jgi:hypothetical protein
MDYPNNDFDSPWKEAIELYFESFMAFFFPAIHSQIDWFRGHEFLDKELEKIVRDAMLGRRYADQLVKVFLKDGAEKWLLIHIEIQGYAEVSFPKRMYIYNYRIFDRYDADVVSLAVLTDDRATYRPNMYQRNCFGCELTFRFPLVKISDFSQDWESLEKSKNPFSKVVMAHLKAIETKDGKERKVWKLRLMRLLYELNFERQDILELFRFIDWLLVLPEELEAEFMQDFSHFEEERKMRYITSVERMGIEKGLQQGLQQGFQRGIQEGIQAGIRQRLQEARDSVLEVLGIRFGVIPEDIARLLNTVEVTETLRSLHRQSVLCKDLNIFREMLDRARSKGD